MKKIIAVTAIILAVVAAGFSFNAKADQGADDNIVIQEPTTEQTEAVQEDEGHNEQVTEDEVTSEQEKVTEPEEKPEKETKEKATESTDVAQDTKDNYKYSEEKIIDSKIDLDNYSLDVVEDNPYKRVMLVKDSEGHKQYKTIFVKKKDMLKIIDLNGGMIYKGKA